MPARPAGEGRILRLSPVPEPRPEPRERQAKRLLPQSPVQSQEGRWPNRASPSRRAGRHRMGNPLQSATSWTPLQRRRPLAVFDPKCHPPHGNPHEGRTLCDVLYNVIKRQKAEFAACRRGCTHHSKHRWQSSTYRRFGLSHGYGWQRSEDGWRAAIPRHSDLRRNNKPVI